MICSIETIFRIADFQLYRFNLVDKFYILSPQQKSFFQPDPDAKKGHFLTERERSGQMVPMAVGIPVPKIMNQNQVVPLFFATSRSIP